MYAISDDELRQSGPGCTNKRDGLHYFCPPPDSVAQTGPKEAGDDADEGADLILLIQDIVSVPPSTLYNNVASYHVP